MPEPFARFAVPDAVLVEWDPLKPRAHEGTLYFDKQHIVYSLYMSRRDAKHHVFAPTGEIFAGWEDDMELVYEGGAPKYLAQGLVNYKALEKDGATRGRRVFALKYHNARRDLTG